MREHVMAINFTNWNEHSVQNKFMDIELEKQFVAGINILSGVLYKYNGLYYLQRFLQSQGFIQSLGLEINLSTIIQMPQIHLTI